MFICFKGSVQPMHFIVQICLFGHTMHKAKLLIRYLATKLFP